MLNLGAVALNALLTFGLGAIVTRGFGPAVAGLFFEAIALFMIVSNTAQLGAQAGVLRLIPRYRALERTQDVRRIIYMGLGPTIVGSVLLGWAMWALAPQLRDLFFETNRPNDPRVVNYLRLLAPFVPVAAVSTVMVSATRGFGAMVPNLVVDTVGKPLFRVVATLVVIALNLGVIALGVAWAAPIILGQVVVVGWLRRLLKRAERRDRYDRRDKRRNGDLAWEFWRFSWPRGLVATLSTSGLWLDTLLVGGILNTTAAAIYTASTRYVGVSLLAIAAIHLVISPQISALLSLGDRDRARAVFQTATEWIMLSSWPVSLALASFAPLLLSLFGPDFTQGQTVLLLLALGSLGFLATGPVSVVLVMGGHSGWSLLNQAVALGVNVVLNLLFIPRFGMNGAAWAWVISGLFGQVAALIQVRLLLGLSPFSRKAGLVAVGAGAIYGLGGILFRLLLGETVLAFATYLVVATAVYVAFIWRFRRAFKLGALRTGMRRGGERRDTAQPI
jgi:O-antigen/teichoic acid export membrane protein